MLIRELLKKGCELFHIRLKHLLNQVYGRKNGKKNSEISKGGYANFAEKTNWQSGHVVHKNWGSVLPNQKKFNIGIKYLLEIQLPEHFNVHKKKAEAVIRHRHFSIE